MLPAVVAGRAHAKDDVGPDCANHPHIVCGDLVAAPLLEGLIDAEREAEVDRPRKVLFRTIEAVQRQELFRPQHTERLENLRSDLVLSAVAPRRRDERRPESLTAI